MSFKDWVLKRMAVSGQVQVGPRFHVGPLSRIWAPRSLTVGADVNVGKHVTIELDGSIGDGVLIANNVGIVGRRDEVPSNAIVAGSLLPVVARHSSAEQLQAHRRIRTPA